MKPILLLLTAVSLYACQPKTGSPSLADYHARTDSGVQTGGVKMIPIETPVGSFKVWTKKFGNNPKIKVLLLHGGPGGTHEFFESFESFFPGEGIEFYEYDQLGSFFSDQPKDSSLWTTERFVEEVEQVRKALGLTKDNFYLLGHSWGGILAMEYALKYQANLKGLIISNMMSSAPAYGKYAADVLAKQMTKPVLDSVHAIEARKDFANPRYMELLIPHFYNQHFCRAVPWPEPINRAMPHLNAELYTIMQGPSEFGVSGRLANWDRSGDLSNITVPTLTIGATHDTMDPEHMKWMAKQVARGRNLTCPNGSHCSMWDDQPHYFPGLISFIQDVDKGAFLK
ncbi:proline iminopeptidase-family hydrolase [Sediminibacterium soli]|uniref:proline iminopeptidase-family hydrolase n=1 Tax=Sediminibacterium soli TaxID=2698829 RepID=UPI0013796C37|nr:proline iminopeptidase-family hydrolase [Sediminibacterium soli]NCI47903.1 proline iminopeptidase-family hydrolase [Sediminibacterium soli]